MVEEKGKLTGNRTGSIPSAKGAAENAARQGAGKMSAADNRAAEAEAQMLAMRRQTGLQDDRTPAGRPGAGAQKFIAEYTIVPGDTLSHVALKYYKNASRDYWMVIYEANKGVIGDNPGIVKAGTVLRIPELPESLKK